MFFNINHLYTSSRSKGLKNWVFCFQLQFVVLAFFSFLFWIEAPDGKLSLCFNSGIWALPGPSKRWILLNRHCFVAYIHPTKCPRRRIVCVHMGGSVPERRK